MAKIVENVVKSISKVAEDDPRRVIHSMKVGLAVTLVSLLYFFQPLFHDFGTSTLWAVLTVVVVFEYSVGNYFVFNLPIHLCNFSQMLFT